MFTAHIAAMAAGAAGLTAGLLINRVITPGDHAVIAAQAREIALLESALARCRDDRERLTAILTQIFLGLPVHNDSHI